MKATGAEEGFRDGMLRQFNALAEKLFRADFTIMVYEAALQIVSFATLVLFLLVGSLQVLDGDLTVGELVAFNTLVVLGNGADHHAALDLGRPADELACCSTA